MCYNILHFKQISGIHDTILILFFNDSKYERIYPLKSRMDG